MSVATLDIKTAFLNGDLNEEVLMEIPEGLNPRENGNYVCRLKKSLYGLKQAPRMWNLKFNSFLVKFGLKRSEFDTCIYFKREESEFLIVAIFEDDGFVCATNEQSVNNVIE